MHPRRDEFAESSRLHSRVACVSRRAYVALVNNSQDSHPHVCDRGDQAEQTRSRLARKYFVTALKRLLLRPSQCTILAVVAGRFCTRRARVRFAAIRHSHVRSGPLMSRGHPPVYRSIADGDAVDRRTCVSPRGPREPSRARLLHITLVSRTWHRGDPPRAAVALREMEAFSSERARRDETRETRESCSGHSLERAERGTKTKRFAVRGCCSTARALHTAVIPLALWNTRPPPSTVDGGLPGVGRGFIRGHANSNSSRPSKRGR